MRDVHVHMHVGMCVCVCQVQISPLLHQNPHVWVVTACMGIGWKITY